MRAHEGHEERAGAANLDWLEEPRNDRKHFVRANPAEGTQVARIVEADAGPAGLLLA
jgi:hypothetical protein